MNVSLMFIFSGNFSFETGLLHCVTVWERYRIIGYCQVLLETRSKFVSQNSPKMQFVTTPTQYKLEMGFTQRRLRLLLGTMANSCPVRLQ